jgi:hypothetical protein
MCDELQDPDICIFESDSPVPMKNQGSGFLQHLAAGDDTTSSTPAAQVLMQCVERMTCDSLFTHAKLSTNMMHI